MSLDRFIVTADNLVEFEANLIEKHTPMTSIHSIEIHKEEFKTIWESVKLSMINALSILKVMLRGRVMMMCGTKLRESEQQLSTPKENDEFKISTCEISIFLANL